MNSGQQLPQDDVLVMVALRNAFYHKKYQLTLGIYLLTLAVNVVLLGTLIFIWKNPVHPYYFATDSVARLIKIVPVTEPNMSTEEVAAWAQEAVQQAYSYDFMNYRGQLQDAQKYFTDYGWRNYMSGLTASNNLIALSERKFVAIAKIVKPPTLVREGILAGAYAWRFEMPVLVTYMAPPYDGSVKNTFQNALKVSVIVQRQSILQSYKGLGVLQIIAVLA